MLSFSAEDMQALEAMVARGVAKGFSNIGLGVDDEADINARRADFQWLRMRRLAAEGFWRSVLRSAGAGISVSALFGALYLLTHLGSVVNFVVALKGGKP